MIKVDMGRVEIKGMKLIVKAEFTTLIHSLVEDTSFTEDDIRDCVKLAFMSKDELESSIAGNIKSSDKKVDEMLDELRKLLLGE